MAKKQFELVAAASVAGLLLMGVGCGGGGGGGATGGTGGHAGAGGTGGAGGHAGSGGSGGHAGAGGAHDGGAAGQDGGPSDTSADHALGASVINFTFNTTDEQFALDTFASTNPINLAAGVVDGGAVPTLGFDGSTGMPAAGSLKITATFTDFSQIVIARRLFASDVQDLFGRRLSAQIKLDGAGDGGGSSSFTGIVHLFAISNGSSTQGQTGYAEGTSIMLTDHTWRALNLDFAHPEYLAPQGIDASTIVQIGLQIATITPPAADAAPPVFGAPQSITVNFDSLISQ